MAGLKQKLRAVWDCPPFPNNFRYAPKALEGGPGWRVHDRREDRVLSDREVREITIEALRTEQLPVQ